MNNYLSPFFAFSCVHRTQVWCTTVTLAASHFVPPAESWHTRPECFPTTRLCHWPNAPKPNTENAVSATCNLLHSNYRLTSQRAVHPPGLWIDFLLHVNHILGQNGWLFFKVVPNWLFKCVTTNVCQCKSKLRVSFTNNIFIQSPAVSNKSWLLSMQ